MMSIHEKLAVSR